MRTWSTRRCCTGSMLASRAAKRRTTARSLLRCFSCSALRTQLVVSERTRRVRVGVRTLKAPWPLWRWRGSRRSQRGRRRWQQRREDEVGYEPLQPATSWRPQAALSSRATCSTAKGVKIWVRHIYDTLATERGRPCASVCRVSCRVVCACAYVLLELVGEKRVEEDMLVQHGGGGLGRAGESRGVDHATGARTGPCAPPHPRCPDRRCAGTPRRT